MQKKLCWVVFPLWYYRSALLELSRTAMALMNSCVLLAPKSYCPTEQNSYMYEVDMWLKMFDSTLKQLFVLLIRKKFRSAGGVSEPPCPYKCICDKYRMPHCFTPLEELMHPFGGPWTFSLLLLCCLVTLGLLINLLRIKLIGSSSMHRGTYSFEQHHFDYHYPHLLSLSEV